MTWRTLDLFCGAAGGWSLGLHRAGFTSVAACEIDPWRRAVFAQNNTGVRMYDDIRTLTADRLLGDLGYLPDIICGSPPCQDASTANTKGKGVDGARTGLFFDAVRLVREVRPRWVLLENVPGLRSRGYDRVHDALEEAGYAVWPLVVGAVHAGAPHLRKRVWIIAADLSRVGCGSGWPGRFDPGDAGEHEQALHDAHTERDRNVEPQGRFRDERGWSGDVRQQWNVADPGKPNTIGRGSPGRRSGRQEANEGSGPLAAWPDWNGGPPEYRTMDDGLSARLASLRVRSDGRRPDERHGRPSRKLKTTGVGRNIIAAYGDAVVPQITEAIGKAVRGIDRHD